MKVRAGFVSNSSSCSFTITNTSNETKTLVDFVKETPHLIEEFLNQYDWHKGSPGYDQEGMLRSAEDNNLVFPPGESRVCVFGDEDGTIIGAVYDYILRDGGQSKSFKWRFTEFLR